MKRKPAILTCLLAATIDALALLVASGTLPLEGSPSLELATVLHLVAVAFVSLSVASYRARTGDTAEGRPTLAILALTLTLCAPVAGALTIACLIAGFISHPPPPAATRNVIVGNPLRWAIAESLVDPIVRSVNGNKLNDLRQAGPLLHRDQSRQSISILQQLQRHRDARTQLQAQSALASLSETFDKQINRLRQMEALPETSRRLASLLHQIAVSGIRDESTSKALLEEAIERLEQALSASALDAHNTTALHVLAECYLASENPIPLPHLIDQLRLQTDGDLIADRIERRYFATTGQWHKLASQVHDTCLNTTVASRNFWAGSPPVS